MTPGLAPDRPHTLGWSIPEGQVHCTTGSACVVLQLARSESGVTAWASRGLAASNTSMDHVPARPGLLWQCADTSQLGQPTRGVEICEASAHAPDLARDCIVTDSVDRLDYAALSFPGRRLPPRDKPSFYPQQRGGAPIPSSPYRAKWRILDYF